MELEIKGVHYDVSDRTKEYIEKKMPRLHHVEDKITTMALSITKEKKNDYIVEVNVHFRWNKDIHIKTEEMDLYKAIDLLFDKLQIKATKEKEKIQEHK